MKRKIWIAYSMVLIVFAGTVARICMLTADQPLLAVGANQGQRRITVGAVRGTIYDCQMKPLVNAQHQYVAAFVPYQDTLERLRPVMDKAEYSGMIKSIQDLTPQIARISQPITTDEHLLLFRIPTRYGDTVYCPHVIGYLGDNGTVGTSGIEKDYDSLLNQYAGNVTVGYSVNGGGEYLQSKPQSSDNTLDNAVGGIALTIDRDIQLIVDHIGSNYIKKGTIVVTKPENGEILALSSYPTFHPNQINQAMKNQDGALINRATRLYDCGSVFKTVTVIAALDHGISTNQCYDCPGKLKIGETTFHCHNRSGHKLLNMHDAYAASCNLYFIQLAAEIGGENMLKTAERLGLTEPIQATDSIVAPATILPTADDLSSQAALANLSFGQGKLLISPLHIARLTTAIANHGKQSPLKLVKGTVNRKQVLTSIAGGEGEIILSSEDAHTLQQMMKLVITSGTGSAAQPRDTDAAGKTGTAETGQFQDGVPVVQSWFTGFYPSDNPQYCITVLVEDAQNNEYSAAEVFCELSNNL